MLVRGMQTLVAQLAGRVGFGALTAIAIVLEAGKRWL